MNAKLKNLGDLVINSFGSIIKSPYRIVCFGVFCLFARDIVYQAKSGPLSYVIEKFDTLSKVLSKMGFDILLLVVILVAMLAVVLVKVGGRNVEP